ESLRSSRAYCLYKGPDLGLPYDSGTVIGPMYSHLARDQETAFHPFDGDLEAFIGAHVIGSPWMTDMAETVLPAGCYFRRLWRGNSLALSVCNPPIDDSGLRVILTRTEERLECLIDDIEQIFRVVYPAEVNQSAYGTKIRSVLLVGCMEVEAQWRGIL